MPKRKLRPFAASELRIFCQIGIAAGQVTFGSMFVTILPIDRSKLPVLLLSLLLTIFFWGSSWFLTRRFRL
jgi:hypothetical protein